MEYNRARFFQSNERKKVYPRIKKVGKVMKVYTFCGENETQKQQKRSQKKRGRETERHSELAWYRLASFPSLIRVPQIKRCLSLSLSLSPSRERGKSERLRGLHIFLLADRARRKERLNNSLFLPLHDHGSAERKRRRREKVLSVARHPRNSRTRNSVIYRFIFLIHGLLSKFYPSLKSLTRWLRFSFWLYIMVCHLCSIFSAFKFFSGEFNLFVLFSVKIICYSLQFLDTFSCLKFLGSYVSLLL